MKKLLILSLCSIVLFSSCSKNNEQSKELLSQPKTESPNDDNTKDKGKTEVNEKPENNQETTKSEETSNNIQKTKERFSDFNDYWTNNPLTKDYAHELKSLKANPSASDCSKLNSKYLELWDNELNSVYTLLLNELDDDAKQDLIQAQKGWLKFNLNENSLFSSSFKRKKLTLEPLYSLQRKNRTKSRTLELIEYYEWISDKYEFNFKREFTTSYSPIDTQYSVFKQKHPHYSSLAWENPLAIAQEKKLDDAHTTLAIGVVISDFSKEWDNELNGIYNLFKNNLPDDEKDLLTQSQLGWISFKENELEFFLKTIYPICGSSASIRYSDLELELTRRRTLELMEYNYLLNNFDFKFLYDNSSDEPKEELDISSNPWMNNPITMDYRTSVEIKKAKESNPRFSKLNLKYYEIWDRELNNIYPLLLRELREDHKDVMITAQKAWLEFHINENKFLLDSLVNRDLDVQPLFSNQNKDRIKARTLKLIWYYEILGYHYDYLYTRECSDLDDYFDVEFLERDAQNDYPIFKINTNTYSSMAVDNPLDKCYHKDMKNAQYWEYRHTIINYLNAWDKELNTVYKDFSDSLSQEASETLIKSQTAWTLFIKNEQDFYRDAIVPLTGSIGRIEYMYECMNFKRRRTLELMEYNYIFNKKPFIFVFRDDR